MKCTKWKSEKYIKCVKKQWKKGGSNFGLKTGSRGTPWNRKNAGPGGSDFTKCGFWSFKWHFGLFQGGQFLMFFSLFHFSIFYILMIFDFIIFCVLSLFAFYWFCRFWCFVNFDQFLSLFILWHHFVSFFVTNLGASMMTHFSPSIPALPLSPLLVVKLWPIFDH